MKLFDLAGADAALRFSPFCWRTRLALAHKGFAPRSVAWRFTDKSQLPSGHKTVPVLEDGATILSDSWAIAEYLETTYPDRPSLFGGPGGRHGAALFNNWVDATLHPILAPMLAIDIFAHIAPQDRDYFRTSREARFGRSLEAAAEGREDRLPAFRALLGPVRKLLAAQQFLGGAAPLYLDHILFGSFQWARMISDFELLAEDDPLAAWRGRLRDMADALSAA